MGLWDDTSFNDYWITKGHAREMISEAGKGEAEEQMLFVPVPRVLACPQSHLQRAPMYAHDFLCLSECFLYTPKRYFGKVGDLIPQEQSLIKKKLDLVDKYACFLSCWKNCFSHSPEGPQQA